MEAPKGRLTLRVSFERVPYCEHPEHSGRRKVASHVIKYKGTETPVCIYCKRSKWPKDAVIEEIKKK